MISSGLRWLSNKMGFETPLRSGTGTPPDGSNAAKLFEDYTAVVPAEFSRIHGDDERVSVAAFRRAVIDHRAIFEAVVHDWRKFERHGDHSGLASGRGGIEPPTRVF